MRRRGEAKEGEGGCSSRVEPQPSKLMMAVRVRSPAPLDTGGLLDVGRRVCGEMRYSRPHSSVVEHFLGKEEVTGSSPVVGSILCYGELVFLGYL